MSDDVLISVDNVSKKFCRDFKRSLWYGVKDMASDLVGGSTASSSSVDPTLPDLRKGEFWANQNISFEVKRGQCLGLIGHNGAGKTTLLKMLNGLIKPDTGRITMKGRIGALIALGAGFNPILTGRENIYVNGSILGLRKKEIDAKLEEIIDFAEIEEAIDAPVRTYSSGMQVRLGFAVAAILVRPDVLILDEVLAVGDAKFHAKCVNTTRSFTNDGVSVVFVSHDLHAVTRHCDRCALLEGGKVIEIGPTAETISHYLEQTPAQEVVDLTTAAGGLEMASPWFTDLAGNQVTEVQADQAFAIHQPIRNTSGKNSRVSFEVAIYDGLGCLLQAMSPAFPLPADKDEVLKINLPPLGYQTSRLNVNVVAWSDPEKLLLNWTRQNTLDLKSVGDSPGRLKIEPEWNIEARTAILEGERSS